MSQNNYTSKTFGLTNTELSDTF